MGVGVQKDKLQLIGLFLRIGRTINKRFNEWRDIFGWVGPFIWIEFKNNNWNILPFSFSLTFYFILFWMVFLCPHSRPIRFLSIGGNSNTIQMFSSAPSFC